MNVDIIITLIDLALYKSDMICYKPIFHMEEIGTVSRSMSIKLIGHPNPSNICNTLVTCADPHARVHAFCIIGPANNRALPLTAPIGLVLKRMMSCLRWILRVSSPLNCLLSSSPD